jgi:amino acid transporter
VGALFLLQTWIATDLARACSSPRPAPRSTTSSALAGGVWLERITLLAVVLASGIANAMAAQAATSRILFAMARDRKLPAVLARIHPRYQTPYISTLVVALVSLLVGVFFSNRVDDLTRVVNFGALTASCCCTCR